MTLHYVQLALRWPRVLAHLRQFHGPGSPVFADEGFLVKTVLTEAFGADAWPRPFRVYIHGPQGMREHGSGGSDAPAGVLAYCTRPVEALRGDLESGQVMPLLRDAFIDDLLVGHPLKEPASGRRFQFQVRLCPTRRQNRDLGGGLGMRRHERDAFLATVEPRGTDTGITREQVYADLLAQALAGAATLECATLEGFALRRLARKGAERRIEARLFPEATLTGTLRVERPAAFMECLGQGIGRHRAYGFGMLLLRPA